MPKESDLESFILPKPADRMFYDGQCGLCHWAVRFVLARDREGTAFRFAPLDSETFRRAVAQAERAKLDPSVVVLTADGRLLTRSAAILHIGRRLGGIWRFLARIAGVIPARLRDWLYGVIARNRYRMFAKPADACPVLPPQLLARFDL